MPLILQDTSGNSWQLVVNPTDQSLQLSPAPGITPTPGSANSLTVTAMQLVTAAMQEIGALASGEVPSTDDQAWVLQKLQRLIDRYNAKRTMVFAWTFSTFALKANHSPHTIGPGADFDVIQRPTEIPTINLVLLSTTGTNVEIPLNSRDKDWWADVRVKNLTSPIPTDFYYEPDWPNGSIFFWPIPTQVNNVLIQTRTIISELTSYNQGFTMPPAYWDAVVYPLAVSLCPSFERQASADLLRLAADSMRAVEANNIKSPRGTTGDAGMPGMGARGAFNYYDGLPK